MGTDGTFPTSGNTGEDTPRLSPVFHWSTPDPLLGDLANPQSLNRYAYVLNDPTSLNDPLGLYCSGAYSENQRDSVCNNSNYGGGGGSGSGLLGVYFESSFLFTDRDDHSTLINYFEQASGFGSGTSSICSNIPSSGKTVPVRADFGQINLQFSENLGTDGTFLFNHAES